MGHKWQNTRVYRYRGLPTRLAAEVDPAQSHACVRTYAPIRNHLYAICYYSSLKTALLDLLYIRHS